VSLNSLKKGIALSIQSLPNFQCRNLLNIDFTFAGIMKKVWAYKRNNIEGWRCGWYESDKCKSKALPGKELAEHYKQIKYTQLNSDVFTGIVTVGGEQMISENYSVNFLLERQQRNLYHP
jgi:hypothetical protein